MKPLSEVAPGLLVIQILIQAVWLEQFDEIINDNEFILNFFNQNT